MYIYIFQRNKTLSYNKQQLSGGVIVRVLASCAVDRGFDPRSGQTKDYKINIGTWRKTIKAKTS